MSSAAAAPDFFGEVFRWHDKYLPPVVLQDRLLLPSEDDLLVLGSPGVMAVERVLREGVSLATYCRTEGAAALLAQMLHALEALTRQGLVRPVAMDDGEPYLVPDFSAEHVRVAISDRVDVITLSNAVSDDAASGWAQAFADTGLTLTLVFCDDYLDPRLGTIDAQQRASGRPWLLVKPTGEQAMVGPIFRPGAATAGPCWHCLAHRWLRNRPARAWWQARHGTPGSGLPVRAGDRLVAERLDQLLPIAQQIATHADAQVRTLDSAQPHSVATRPQCPHCGTPGLVAQRQRERIVLEPGPPIARRDGGWRTVPASATVERLMRHVSPLCGVIARIAPLNAESEGALTVYRSEIFRTPPPGDDLLPGALTQICLGKGMSMDQSRASALCEAAERYAAFHQGDEASVVAFADDLDARCIQPQALALFSDRQRERFDTAHKPPHAVASSVSSVSSGLAWWTPAWSLTADERCYLPLAFCFAHAPAQSQSHVSWTSNGCAAGNTREEAILQGFLELVERDAAAIWWYGEVPRPAIDLGGLSGEICQRVERTCGPQWDRWVLDITHDFGIPVAVAIGRHLQTGAWAIGFGCSPDRALACERALTEMSQLIAAGKTFAVQRADGEAREEGPPRFLMPSDAGNVVPAPAARTDIAEEIRRCVAIAAALGLETIVLDHTRPDIPLHTVKVVVPGLCHIWPELGNPRLYRVPVAMGWRDTPVCESDLNPQALYV